MDVHTTSRQQAQRRAPQALHACTVLATALLLACSQRGRQQGACAASVTGDATVGWWTQYGSYQASGGFIESQTYASQDQVLGDGQGAHLRKACAARFQISEAGGRFFVDAWAPQGSCVGLSTKYGFKLHLSDTLGYRTFVAKDPEWALGAPGANSRMRRAIDATKTLPRAAREAVLERLNALPFAEVESAVLQGADRARECVDGLHPTVSGCKDFLSTSVFRFELDEAGIDAPAAALLRRRAAAESAALAAQSISAEQRALLERWSGLARETWALSLDAAAGQFLVDLEEGCARPDMAEACRAKVQIAEGAGPAFLPGGRNLFAEAAAALARGETDKPAGFGRLLVERYVANLRARREAYGRLLSLVAGQSIPVYVQSNFSQRLNAGGNALSYLGIPLTSEAPVFQGVRVGVQQGVLSATVDPAAAQSFKLCENFGSVVSVFGQSYPIAMFGPSCQESGGTAGLFPLPEWRETATPDTSRPLAGAGASAGFDPLGRRPETGNAALASGGLVPQAGVQTGIQGGVAGSPQQRPLQDAGLNSLPPAVRPGIPEVLTGNQGHLGRGEEVVVPGGARGPGGC